MRCDDACSASHRGLFGVRQLKLAARRRIHHESSRLLHPRRGTNDLAIDLNGNWSAPINIGASGLPTGVSVASTPVIDFYYWTLGGDTLSYGTAPIPAGWSNGTGPVRVVPQPDPQDYTLDAEGYVALAVSSGRQANSSFNITLWASDGTATQTETVPVVIQASCKRHY